MAHHRQKYHERSKYNLAVIGEIEADADAPEQCKKAASQIREALIPAQGERSLVSLDTSNPDELLAAIAIGNLDEADVVTWLVPGINITVSDSLVAWTATAQNLYDIQTTTLNDLADTTTKVAVVSWIGYDTPELSGVWTVESAHRGGTRLATEVDTFRQFYGTGPHVNILGHSYGTNTVLYCLTQVGKPVSTAVLLGSSGINREDIPTVDVLNVSKDTDGNPEVWVSTAAKDLIAQGSTQAATVGSALLSMIPFAGSEITDGVRFADPRGDWLGAKVFSADGGPDPLTGEELAATTTHDTINGSSGYLDIHTQCARSVSLITTKRGELVPLLDGPGSASEQKAESAGSQPLETNH